MHQTIQLAVHDPVAVQRALERSSRDLALMARMRDAANLRDGCESAFYIVRHSGQSPWAIMAEMAQAGIGVYCPVEKTQVRRGKSGKVCVGTVPKYPGYFFVQLPVGCNRAFVGVLSFRGVAALMGNASGPRPISLEIMDKIRKPMAVKRTSIRLLFAVGEAVRIANGPFADMEAIVRQPAGANGKVMLDIDILGGMVPVLMGVDSLRKI